MFCSKFGSRRWPPPIFHSGRITLVCRPSRISILNWCGSMLCLCRHRSNNRRYNYPRKCIHLVKIARVELNLSWTNFSVTLCWNNALWLLKRTYVHNFFKLDQPRPLFCLFLVFSNKQYNFYNKSMWKMSIQYPALGFEPTTFGTWVYSHNH